MSQLQSQQRDATQVNMLHRLWLRAGRHRDLLGWLVLTVLGLALTAWAVHVGAHLGTAGAPFLGRYRWQFSISSMVAPLVAVAVRGFTQDVRAHSVSARGHPPGPVLLLWSLQRAGLTDRLALALLITAVGALTVPLVLGSVREVCGETPARRYAPVLILAPSAIWAAVSVDVIVAVLGAAMVAAGVRASARRRTGLRAGAWALLAGALLGVAALFSYAAPWLGLSVVCLYFARRRPFLNLGTGLGALAPVVLADRLGFAWLSGLFAARDDYVSRVEPYRSAPWWTAISLVVLLLVAGPPLFASLRKLRNTPGWPFLVGAAVAVIASILAGIARGGAEHAWLPFFPWLTVAAVAPETQGGEPVPAPLSLAGVGALVAIVIEAVLATPW